jgi:large subunit ribosomal protein L17
MRHRKDGRQFGRNTSHRRAMFRGLTANLVLHERIETTDAKAKELRRVAEKLITRARRLGPIAFTPHEKLKPGERARRLAAKRQIGKFLRRFGVKPNGAGSYEQIDLLEKVFVDLAKRFQNRQGGYTRIIKMGNRRGENAPMVLIEFVDRPEKAPAKASAEAAAPVAEEKPAVKKEAKKPAKKEATEAKAAEASEEKPAKKKAASKKKTDEE